MTKSRSVQEDIQAFCGWDFLLKLINAAPSLFMQGLMAALFGTGGRISEVLALRKLNIDLSLHPEVVVVKQMPLMKRFEKVGKVTKWKCVGHCNKRWKEKPTPVEYSTHKIEEYEGWITKSVEDNRTFPIRLDEPLTSYLVDWYKTVRRKNELLFPIKRSAAFVKIRNVGRKLDADIPFCSIRSPLLYGHWFRAQRACQLAFEYGFDNEDLERFFEWKERKPSMAEHYASLGWIGLARKMGVKT
ncbi:hypothetical protein ES702_02501 [subsurface metagenome]